MPDIDIAIGPVGLQTNVAMPKKPSYLIIFDEAVTKNKISRKFVTLDKPEFVSSFVQVKGFFTDLSEDEVIKNFPDILTTTPKELIIEVLLAGHKISHMRSLVFKQK